MADIELVIKIDEKLYKDIYSDAEIMIYGGMRSGKTLLSTLLRAIRNSTPLPKGHGDLIDRNDLLSDSYCINDWSGNEVNIVDVMTVKMADTIIDADKAESEDEE